MKRPTVIRTFLGAIRDEDLLILIGKPLHSEAVKYDKGNILYIPEDDYMISFSLGITMSTKKRVYIVCEEGYFIRNLSEFMQGAISRAKNLFFILLCSGGYSDFLDAPTPFDSVGSKMGLFYNMGFLVHNYTNHFSLSNTIKELSKILDNTKGPLVAYIKNEVSAKKVEDVEIDYKGNAQKIRNILMSVKE